MCLPCGLLGKGFTSKRNRSCNSPEPVDCSEYRETERSPVWLESKGEYYPIEAFYSQRDEKSLEGILFILAGAYGFSFPKLWANQSWSFRVATETTVAYSIREAGVFKNSIYLRSKASIYWNTRAEVINSELYNPRSFYCPALPPPDRECCGDRGHAALVPHGIIISPGQIRTQWKYLTGNIFVTHTFNSFSIYGDFILIFISRSAIWPTFEIILGRLCSLLE